MSGKNIMDASPQKVGEKSDVEQPVPNRKKNPESNRRNRINYNHIQYEMGKGNQRQSNSLFPGFKEKKHQQGEKGDKKNIMGEPLMKPGTLPSTHNKKQEINIREIGYQNKKQQSLYISLADGHSPSEQSNRRMGNGCQFFL